MRVVIIERRKQRGALAQRLYPWFYGGLFLDEKFNSLAFALWAPPAPARSVAAAPPAHLHPAASGVTP